MPFKTITAVFNSRRQAEEAVTQLSQIGLTNIFIKTSPNLPDFSPASIGSFSFLFNDIGNFDLTTVTGTISEDRSEEADQIIEKNGGIK